MDFRTTFQIPKAEFSINHFSKILTIGSCFSDEIGSRLIQLKYKSLINPFGVIFNAYSIQKLIERSIHQSYFNENDVHQNGDQFFCYDVHSSFNSLSKDAILSQLNQTINQVHQFLIDADVLILTLGTSWVYKRHENQDIVANCHKIPQKEFDKYLLTPEENFKSLDLIAFEVKKINPKIQIITTLSPVRHIKDGFFENNVSKGRLLDVIYQINNKHKHVTYFPSYELVIDDLRDYRFFKEDYIHPNDQAVNYIWKRFSETYFSDETIQINTKIQKIINSVNHRPFNEASESHQKFLIKTLEQIQDFEGKYNVDFTEEKNKIQEKIISC